MGVILHLETATTNCSVSVAREGRLLALKEENTPHFSHAEQLHLFISAVMEAAGLPLTALDAVAVSKGPGSYTGLRIGVSSVKGLCFALDIPLIAIPTLEHMAYAHRAIFKGMIIPVLDARRMEVYSEVYDEQGQLLVPTRAQVIDGESFSAYKEGQVAFIGSGAAKIAQMHPSPNFTFKPQAVPSAKDMVSLAWERYKHKNFEDVAYFEPFYLKDFIVTKPNKKK